MANVKATDLIEYTRASKGHALAKVSYGSELVENGTFDSGDFTGFATVGSAWSVVSNQAIASDTSSTNNFLTWSSGAAAGKIYFGSVDVISNDVIGNSYIQWGLDTNTRVTSPSAGTYTQIFIGSVELFRANMNASGGSLVLDNISVKEVTFNQADGTLQLFEHPNNIPRIEYDADGNLLGLLIEESRTNLVTASNNATISSARMEASKATGPDGSSDAQQWKAVKAEGPYLYQQANITSIGVNYSFSVFVRAPRSTPKIPLRYVKVLSQTTINNSASVFDLEDGTVISTTAISASITKMNDGWYRLQVTEDSKATGSSFNFIVWPATNSSGSSLVVSQSQLNNYVIETFGWQLEQASFPTSYIKTTGSTATRSADVASIDVDQFGYNQNEGTVLVQASTNAPLGSRTNDGIFSLKKDNNDLHRVYVSASDALNWQMRQGGSTVFATAIINNLPAEQEFKISLSWHSGSQDGSYDGNAATNFGTGTTMADTAVDLNIGYINTTDYLNGHIKSIKYFPKRLSNAKLQELTS